MARLIPGKTSELQGPAPVASGGRRVRLIRSTIGIATLLIAAIAAATWMLLANLRSDQIANGGRDLESMATVLAEQIDRSFQSIEVVQTAVIERIARLGLSSSADLEKHFSDYATHERLRDQISGLPHIDAVIVSNADGRVVNFTREWPVPNIQAAINPARAFVVDPTLTSYIGKPLRNPANGVWVLPIIRKIGGTQGEVLGIVIGVMRLQYFEDYFKSIARNEDRSIALFDGDATLVVRHPFEEKLRGKSFAKRDIFKNVLSVAEFGTVRQEALDGGELLISGRKLPHFPMAVVITKKVVDVLAGWRYAALYVAGAALFIVIMIGGATLIVARQFGKNLQAENRRLDAALNNMSQGLAMFDASRRLIVCNQQYIDMYNLRDEGVVPGITLGELLRKRVKRESFHDGALADPDEYAAKLASDVAQGKRSSVIVDLHDGRTIAMVNQPMAGGGWLSTHQDITEAKRREASFRLLFDSNPVPMWVFDLDTLRFLAVNDAAITQYGYGREEFMAMTTLDIRPPEDRERLLQSLRDGGGNHDGVEMWRHRKANGREMAVLVYAHALDYEGHKACIVAVHDVTDRQRAEEQLRRTQKFLDTIVEYVPVPILVKDVPRDMSDPAECQYTLVNRATEELLGVSRADIVGKTPHALYSKEQADRIVAGQAEVIKFGHPVTLPGHPLNTVKNGTRIVTSKCVAVRDDNDRPQYLLTVIEDITERQRAEQRIARMAHYDNLTDLPNRPSFNDELECALERATKEGTSFTVLSLDLDGFKDANDTYGHSVGDALLCKVARRLQAVAGDAFVARLGGDEFALIVTHGKQPGEAMTLANRLLDAFIDDIVVDDRCIAIGATIGGAAYPVAGTDARTLMVNADIALYRAKAETRGTALFFDAAMGEEVRERRALEEDLRQAVARGELLLHYQPQKKMNGETIGFEALVRWQCPKRGMVAPGLFIPMAEECGAIIELGEWVLREACREAASWAEPLTIAVNVSPIQFHNGDLPSRVRAILIETGLTPSRLELEITEGVLIDDFTRALSILCRLKALGVKIALDDFGTGYSSLSYLHSFSFDKIKIDRAFVGDLERNQHSRAIVSAVIDLGRSLNVPTLAEGVETQAQHAMLLAEGCDEVQGYLTGRPRPIAHYAELVGSLPTAHQRRALAG